MPGFLKSSAPHTICKERRGSDWNLRNFNLKRPLRLLILHFEKMAFLSRWHDDAHLKKSLSPGTSIIEEQSHPLFRSITRQMASTTSEASIFRTIEDSTTLSKSQEHLRPLLVQFSMTQGGHFPLDVRKSPPAIKMQQLTDPLEITSYLEKL